MEESSTLFSLHKSEDITMIVLCVLEYRYHTNSYMQAGTEQILH